MIRVIGSSETEMTVLATAFATAHRGTVKDKSKKDLNLIQIHITSSSNVECWGTNINVY